MAGARLFKISYKYSVQLSKLIAYIKRTPFCSPSSAFSFLSFSAKPNTYVFIEVY